MAIAKPSKSTLSLAGSDFTILKEPKKQANVLLFGDGGTGKTTFCTMYAPQPIAMINFDKRSHHAVVKAQKQGRIIAHAAIDTPANISRLPDEAARKIGQAALDKVIKNFEWAVVESQKGNIRTICLDTGTEYSEIISLAIRGRVDRVKSDYGKSKDLINREWWRLFNLAREGSAHLIVLSRAKAVWQNNEPTGRFTFRGPEVMFDAADWAGQIRLKKQKRGVAIKEFEIEIHKAGINIEELGEVYTKEEWEYLGGPFVYACYKQFYETSTLEDWQ